MTAPKKVGAKIKEKRIALRFTQERLAELSGMDPSFISGVEAGKRNVSLTTLEKIIKALNSDINDFVDYSVRGETKKTKKELKKKINMLLSSLDIRSLEAFYFILKQNEKIRKAT